MANPLFIRSVSVKFDKGVLERGVKLSMFLDRQECRPKSSGGIRIDYPRNRLYGVDTLPDASGPVALVDAHRSISEMSCATIQTGFLKRFQRFEERFSFLSRNSWKDGWWWIFIYGVSQFEMCKYLFNLANEMRWAYGLAYDKLNKVEHFI